MGPCLSTAEFSNTQHSPSMARLREVMPKTMSRIRDFCIPVNGYFPPAELLAELSDELPQILKYYPTTAADLTGRLSVLVGIDERFLVLGNGSTELISWIDELLVSDTLAIPVPTFSRWTDDPKIRGVKVATYQRREANDFRLDPAEYVDFVLSSGARCAVLCNPNNPTGAFMPLEEIYWVLERLSGLDLVVIDESFIDFSDEASVPTVACAVTKVSNLLVLKSLGKNYGLHGVRLGYAITSPERARFLRQRIPYWNLNGISESLLKRLPRYLSLYEAGRRKTVLDSRAFEAELRRIPGLTVYPSRANFVYVKAPSFISGTELRDRLLNERGLLVRECGNKEGSSSQFLRIAARPPEERGVLVEAMQEIFASASPKRALVVD